MELEKEIKQKKFRDPYEKAAVNVIYTASWLNHLLHECLKPYHLTSQQYNILRILRGQNPKPASISLLIERMLDKMSNVSRLVDKLEFKGLVARKTCESDRRQVDVLISRKGLSILELLDVKIKETFKRLETLDRKEAEQLNLLLDRLRG